MKTALYGIGILSGYLAQQVWRELREDDATHLAAGVAYYAIFSLFPLILGLLALSGMFLGSADLQRQFLAFIGDNLPGAEGFVVDNVEIIVRFRGAAGLVAILGLFWGASAVFGAISLAVNRAWDVHDDRSFFVAKARQLGMGLGVGVIFWASMAATSTAAVLGQHAGSVGVELASQSAKLLGYLITFGMFLLLYRYVPNTKTYWRYVWVGALVAAGLFEFAKNVFVWYLANFANFEQAYGSLASVMAFLLWAYVSALVLILGAEISSEYERLRSVLGIPPDSDL